MEYSRWILKKWFETVLVLVVLAMAVFVFAYSVDWSKPVDRDWPTWKTVRIGTPGLETAGDFRDALKASGFNIDSRALDILGKPAFVVAVEEETKLDLVVVSVAELGFKNGATLEQIYARAKALGLDLCSAEVGPQLRLQYQNQPNGEWLVIAMKPIAVDGLLGLFGVERFGFFRRLSSDFDGPGHVWSSDYRFVFARRK